MAGLSFVILLPVSILSLPNLKLLLFWEGRFWIWLKEQHFLQQIDWRKNELAVWCCFEVWVVQQKRNVMGWMQVMWWGAHAEFSLPKLLCSWHLLGWPLQPEPEFLGQLSVFHFFLCCLMFFGFYFFFLFILFYLLTLTHSFTTVDGFSLTFYMWEVVADNRYSLGYKTPATTAPWSKSSVF